MQVALVYDRVNTAYGGAEQVLSALHELFPEAPLYTALYDAKKTPWAKKFSQIRPSFLNKIKFLRNKHRWLAFLMPLAFESFDFSDYDLVISVTSAEAKGIITQTQTKHICYLLTPPRYLYSHKSFYQKHSLFYRLPLLQQLTNQLINYLTNWDQLAIHRPDVIIPISQLIKKRANKYYPQVKIGPVIYPTVIDHQSTNKPVNQSTNYYLIVSRLVDYKKIDQAIIACQQLKKKLVIVGHGPEFGNLKFKIKNSPQIKIFPQVAKAKIAHLYQHCSALLMPGEEDFGIVALEALSYGKPVIIHHSSGAAELIR